MSNSDTNGAPPPRQMVVGIFASADAFVGAVQALLAADFGRSDISVLARQEVLRGHFGDVIPAAEQLADDPAVPRQTVADVTSAAVAGDGDDGATHWLAHLVAEGIAAIGLIGTAGLAYAVGGPIGIAAVAGDTAESSLEAVLRHGIDDAEAGHYRSGLAGGAVVCWVTCRDADAIATATRLLTAGGATGIHPVRVDPPGLPD